MFDDLNRYLCKKIAGYADFQVLSRPQQRTKVSEYGADGLDMMVFDIRL